MARFLKAQDHSIACYAFEPQRGRRWRAVHRAGKPHPGRRLLGAFAAAAPPGAGRRLHVGPRHRRGRGGVQARVGGGIFAGFSSDAVVLRQSASSPATGGRGDCRRAGGPGVKDLSTDPVGNNHNPEPKGHDREACRSACCAMEDFVGQSRSADSISHEAATERESYAAIGFQ